MPQTTLAGREHSADAFPFPAVRGKKVTAAFDGGRLAVTLDIDDTCDVVHGNQQLSFWNGHHGERCFLPIHIYDTATGRPVAMLLRTGKTPSGKEAAGHIRRLVRHLRRHWPDTHITRN
jgi:hypothetical protein